MGMDVDRVTNNSRLRRGIEEARDLIGRPEHAISDVHDAEGNQYVDLVMEGGGMLGIALVGYTWALEEMGIRFLGIGGTSAGSINALLLAAMDDPARPKSPPLLEALAELNFYDFVDGDGSEKGKKRSRRLIELALDGRPMGFRKGVAMVVAYLRVRRQLMTGYGLNCGDAFTAWLTGLLESAGVKSTADLLARLDRVPALSLRADREPPPGFETPRGRLVIIGSDITTETRVEFPEMADLYWADPQSQNPASYARASMSIPGFFETFRVTGLPSSEAARERWEEVGLDLAQDNAGKVPQFALFVDGGVMSNFPIDTFHDHARVPTRPTLGVKLEFDNRYKPPTRLPLHGDGGRQPLLSLLGATFSSARHTLDYEFVKRNPDYRHLVQFIPCTYEEAGETKSYNWIDFNMPEKHREGLFVQGAEKAIEFIKGFGGPVDADGRSVGSRGAGDRAHASRWTYYKQLRKELLTQA